MELSAASHVTILFWMACDSWGLEALCCNDSIPIYHWYNVCLWFSVMQLVGTNWTLHSYLSLHKSVIAFLSVMGSSIVWNTAYYFGVECSLFYFFKKVYERQLIYTFLYLNAGPDSCCIKGINYETCWNKGMSSKKSHSSVSSIQVRF